MMSLCAVESACVRLRATGEPEHACVNEECRWSAARYLMTKLPEGCLGWSLVKAKGPIQRKLYLGVLHMSLFNLGRVSIRCSGLFVVIVLIEVLLSKPRTHFLACRCSSFLTCLCRSASRSFFSACDRGPGRSLSRFVSLVAVRPSFSGCPQTRRIKLHSFNSTRDNM